MKNLYIKLVYLLQYEDKITTIKLKNNNVTKKLINKAVKSIKTRFWKDLANSISLF